jgi:hypothetical protein
MLLMMTDFLLCIIWLPVSYKRDMNWFVRRCLTDMPPCQIGVSRTYGFRSAKEVFTGQCEGFKSSSVTNAVTEADCVLLRQWNGCSRWLELVSVFVSVRQLEICWEHRPNNSASFPSLFAAGVVTGFDAAGHVAEETKNAS